LAAQHSGVPASPPPKSSETVILLSGVSTVALIYRSSSSGTAEISVCDVGSQGLADLLVYQTDDQGLARSNDGVWCFVGSSGLATTTVWFTDSQGSADLKICFVSSRGLADWRRGHALQGWLG
jgi:hypothetical protein